MLAALGVRATCGSSPHRLAASQTPRLRVASHNRLRRAAFNPGPEHTFADPATNTYIGTIDFGDAYISHPALDLRRWKDPADREALLDWLSCSGPVETTFMSVWRVTQVWADLAAIASAPAYVTAAHAHLQRMLERTQSPLDARHRQGTQKSYPASQRLLMRVAVMLSLAGESKRSATPGQPEIRIYNRPGRLFFMPRSAVCFRRLFHRRSTDARLRCILCLPF